METRADAGRGDRERNCPCLDAALCAERRADRRCRPVDAAAGGYDGLKEPASRTLLRARDGSRSRRVAKDVKQDTKYSIGESSREFQTYDRNTEKPSAAAIGRAD